MKKGLILIVSVAILIGILLFAGTEESRKGLTGAATTQTTSSDATIQAYFAIALSNNLSAGISFGSIAALPAVDINASVNYNGSFNNNTGYSVDVSSDSNVNVDLCLKADKIFNTSGDDYIGLGNWTYSQNTTNNFTIPALNVAVQIRLNYSNGTTGVSPSNSNYYRFWLDVPGAQAAGIYNNTVTFKGLQTGGACN